MKVMKIHPSASNPRINLVQKRGFALVVTLSLMILLTILAIGMLSLSSIALRSSSQSGEVAIARSNARLALMLAIGNLQKMIGPDQRITARAATIHGEQGNPDVVGAWKSYRWDPESGGAPDYSAKASNFLGWVTSSPIPGNAELIDYTAKAPNTAVLLRSASGSELALQAETVPIRNRHDGGACAYSAVDQSLKVTIDLAESTDDSLAAIVAQRTAPSRFQPEVIAQSLSPEALTDMGKLVTLETAVLASRDPSGRTTFSEQKNNLATGTLGLLTDVVNGGFKKDLSGLLESASSPQDITGRDTLYFSANDGAPTWSYLKDHYAKYKQVSGSIGGKPTYSVPTLNGDTNGVAKAPVEEQSIPVIAKLQIVFSLVAHDLSKSLNEYNQFSPEKDHKAYEVPSLVFDPVVTLYNPYDVSLDLQKYRIRIWTPPVTFAFQKDGAWLLNASANGIYQSLAQFRGGTAGGANSGQYFTLFFRGTAADGRPSNGPLKLEPGEVKVYSPSIEPTWTWQMELDREQSIFYDRNSGELDMGNEDSRFGSDDKFGLRMAEGYDVRAGFHMDNTAAQGTSRPNSTRYDFELKNKIKTGWVAIRKQGSTLGIVVRPERAVANADMNNPNVPDFRVDILAGNNVTQADDVVRSFKFRFQDVAAEVGADLDGKDISRQFEALDVYKANNDDGIGGKKPFAILTMEAKSTLDETSFSMPWLHNNPVVEGAEQDTRSVGRALDSYDLRLQPMTGFNNVPGVPIDEENRGFYGARTSLPDGTTHVPMFRLPVSPAASLGDLIPANLVASAALPRFVHPFGNSRAHPLLPADSVSIPSPVTGQFTQGGKFLDHSYLLNDALWDQWFFRQSPTRQQDWPPPLTEIVSSGSSQATAQASATHALRPCSTRKLPKPSRRQPRWSSQGPLGRGWRFAAHSMSTPLPRKPGWLSSLPLGTKVPWGGLARPEIARTAPRFRAWHFHSWVILTGRIQIRGRLSTVRIGQASAPFRTIRLKRWRPIS